MTRRSNSAPHVPIIVQSRPCAGLAWLERRSVRTADRITSTNESDKAIAVSRGGRRPAHVIVVRSGPDTKQRRPIYPASPRPADGIIQADLSIMAPRDGVDQVLLVMDELVHARGRTQVTAILLGFGDCLKALTRPSTALGQIGRAHV